MKCVRLFLTFVSWRSCGSADFSKFADFIEYLVLTTCISRYHVLFHPLGVSCHSIVAITFTAELIKIFLQVWTKDLVLVNLLIISKNHL